MYTAADIVKIYMTLQSNSILIQTRVNMLNNWIRSLNNKEEILNVSYNSELPKEYQDQYDFVTETTGDLLFTIIEKFFPEQQEEVSDESEG
jgi:GTP-sensing pleiotropic transcriptional regulator CodY